LSLFCFFLLAVVIFDPPAKEVEPRNIISKPSSFSVKDPPYLESFLFPVSPCSFQPIDFFDLVSLFTSSFFFCGKDPLFPRPFKLLIQSPTPSFSFTRLFPPRLPPSFQYSLSFPEFKFRLRILMIFSLFNFSFFSSS